MGPLSLAEARSRGYGLLGSVLLRGLTGPNLDRIRQTPLAAHLSDPLDADGLAAAHHRLLSMEVHPYASLFLTAEEAGCIDGIRDACALAGFHIDTTSARPDHLGIMLLLLSFLCGATADALADDRPEVAARTEALAQGFLARWLVPWLAPLQAAVAACDDGFWGAAVQTACGLAEDHWDGGGSLVLPEPPALLSDESTGVKGIARYLLTPCHSGVYLSRADIGGLAGAVPRGFGSRQQELTNLLRTAAEYGELVGVVERLVALLERRRAETQGPHAAGWQDRVSESVKMVETIRDEVRQE